MKKRLVILSHLGLGDQLICAGMAIKFLLSEEFEKIYYPTKARNIKSVRRLFNKFPEIKLPSLEDDIETHDPRGRRLSLDFEFKEEGSDYWDSNVHGPLTKKLLLGFWTDDGVREIAQEHRPFTEVFYEQAKMDQEVSWSHFPLERDSEEESSLERKLNISKEDEYIFVHSESNGIGSCKTHSENTELLPEQLRRIRPDPKLSETIFEYCGIIENAKEVHCIDSSFALLADRLDLSKVERICIHRYARKESQEASPTTYKLDWELI